MLETWLEYYNKNKSTNQNINNLWFKYNNALYEKIYHSKNSSGKTITIKYQKGYGYLYNWYVTQEPLITSSDEWRIPSDAEWIELIDYVTSLGYPNDYSPNNAAASVLASCRQILSPLGGDCAVDTHPAWNYHPFSYGRNLFNLDILPGGYRRPDIPAYRTISPYFDGGFSSLTYIAQMWTSDPTVIWREFARYSSTSDLFYIYRVYWYLSSYGELIKNIGLSIRFIRDLSLSEQLLSDGTYLDDYIGNDGKLYKVVKIGNQAWITSHLAETKFRNKTNIPFENTPGQGNFSNEEWGILTTPARCASSNNEFYVTIDY